MTDTFPNLFTPLKVGTKTAKNRIMFPAHGVPLPFMDDGVDGNAYIEYQAARAKGPVRMQEDIDFGRAARSVRCVKDQTPRLIRPGRHTSG